MKPILSIKKLNMRLGENAILSDVNLQLGAGEKLVLATPSGSGKSSLLKALLGILPAKAENFQLFDEKLDNKTIGTIRKQISYLGQDAAFPNGSVADFVSETIAYVGNTNLKENPEGIESHLAFFDLPTSILKQKISNISGGERARLGLSMVAWLNQPLNLLDEPTAALDAQLAERVVEWVASSPNSFVVVSHDSIWQREEFKIIKDWKDARN